MAVRGAVGHGMLDCAGLADRRHDLQALIGRAEGRSNLWKVSFPLNNSSAISTPFRTYQLEAVPNPTRDKIEIYLHVGKPDLVNLLITDLQGKEVMQAKDWHLQAGDNRLRLDLGKLPAGMYVVRAEGKHGTGALRIVIE